MKAVNQGKRLRLRRCNEQDLDFVWMTIQNNDFQRICLPNIMDGLSQENVRASLITMESLNPMATGSLYFTIEHPCYGPIGIAFLNDYTPTHRRCEQVIAISAIQYWGKGYGIEAELLLLDLIFNHYQMIKVYGYAYDYNPIGHQIAVRCGFTDEGEMRQHCYLTKQQRYANLHVHGLIEPKFRDNTFLAGLAYKLLGRDITRKAHV